MEPRELRQEEKKAPNTEEARTPERKRRFRIVKLEARIAPGGGCRGGGCHGGHPNITLNGACK